MQVQESPMSECLKIYPSGLTRVSVALVVISQDAPTVGVGGVVVVAGVVVPVMHNKYI